MATKQGVKNDESRVSGAADAQDDGATGGAWLDLVFSDLEGSGYACAAIAFPSSSVGAPHIRDRLYWVAYAGQHHIDGKTKTASNSWPKADRPANQPSLHSSLDGVAWPAEWVLCPDGFKRPIEPGLCAVVDEHPGRVEQLRAYGNAINANTAQVFIECVMDSIA